MKDSLVKVFYDTLSPEVINVFSFDEVVQESING